MDRTEEKKMIDHDLLIEINTKLSLLIQQFNEHRSNTIKEIAVLQTDKMDKDEHKKKYTDHETRIRRIELWGAIAFGAILVIQAVLGFKVI